MIPDIKKGDFVKFRNLLNDINWNNEFNDKTANEMWTKFIGIITNF